MNLLSADKVSLVYGDRYILKDINFGLNKGDRVGLIGVNGTGKTTFLKVLAGLIRPESGGVSTRRETRVGFLGQNPELLENETVLTNVFRNGHPLTGTVERYEELAAHPREDAAYLTELDRVTAEMTRLDAWNYEHRIKEAISRLGIGGYIDRKVSELSGGQRKRVALARILAEEPDVLILDEPTNHLDIDMVEWLQRLIRDQFDSFILVTHDRYFLDAVTNCIVELEYGELYRYEGNYAYYLEKKAERDEARQAEADKNRNLYRRELEWIRRQPKARTTKSRARIDAFDVLKTKIDGPVKEEQVKLEVKDRKQGGKVLEVLDISMSLGGRTLIHKFRHIFVPGDRAGILGPNGSGKTTLLKLLTGKMQPDEGAVVPGENTVFGYYSQEEALPASDMSKRVIDVVTDLAEFMELSDGSRINASQFLNRFKFPPKEQYKIVEQLSGGERRRLQLLKILIRNPNFLILDEPTNDLDIGTLNVLEEFLESFKGSVLLVSHDRYFMDRLVDHVFVFEEGGHIRDFHGNYTEYREWKLEQDRQKEKMKEAERAEKSIQSAEAKEKTVVTDKSGKRKLSYKEQKALEAAEAVIARIEKRKPEIEAEMNGGTSDHVKLMELGKELQALEQEYETAMMTWMELSE